MKPPHIPHNIETWHRSVCRVTDWLILSGDLPPERQAAIAKLDEWIAAGVTDVVDVRGEWSDERLVATLAPDVRYHYLGTHDDGGTQDATWFEAGLATLHDAKQHQDAVLMVHCHMGVNRGPSMALAMLLDEGWDVVDALNAIRDARPIAGVIYAKDAVRAVGARKGRSERDVATDLARVSDWFNENQIDISTIIRRIRQAS